MNSTVRIVSICFALMAGALGVGCSSSDCESVCEDGKDCKGTNNTSGIDCEEQCSKVEKDNETVGCTSQYEAWSGCLSDQDDVCSTTTSTCASARNAYLACTATYCQAHPNDAVCKP